MPPLPSLRRRPTETTDTSSAVLEALDPRHLDPEADLYVPPEDRPDYVAVASDRKQMRALEDTVRELRTSGWTELDASGRIVGATPAPFEVRLHREVLDTARTIRARREARETAAQERRTFAEATTRCDLCGHHGADPDHPTGAYLVSAAGALEPRYGIDGTPVRLHTGCAAAVTEAARIRLDADRVAAAGALLDRLGL